MTKRIAIILGGVGIYVILGLLNRFAGHAPALLEEAYTTLAPDLNMPALCEKISSRAYRVFGFNPSGSKVVYTKAECYENVALKTQSDSYCSKAGRLDLFFDRSAENTCRELVNSRSPYSLSAGCARENILRAAGYSDKDLNPADGRERQCGSEWARLYSKVLNNGELRQRSELLPDFSKWYD